MTDQTSAAVTSADLFSPVAFGPYLLKNRMIMAPLTRSRAKSGDVPGDLAALYYSQRADAGLIITEATQISPQGKGYAYTPGIYNESHVDAWRAVTNSVHRAGGRIFLQLWHVGRISHPSLQPDGALPVAPSAVKPAGDAFTDTGFQPFVTPRALDRAEMENIVDQHRTAAQYAKDAGFDGVEVHAANGYLLDQFLRDGTNQRTDDYGGSFENRTRLLIEVTRAVIEIWGADRVGVRISPLSPFNDMVDSAPEALFSHVAMALDKLGILYLHVVEGETAGARDVAGGFDIGKLRGLFHGVYMGNNGYDRDSAIAARAADRIDLAAFGRLFLANPDLVRRFEESSPLNALDGATLYGGDAKGYTDYPFLVAPAGAAA